MLTLPFLILVEPPYDEKCLAHGVARAMYLLPPLWPYGASGVKFQCRWRKTVTMKFQEIIRIVGRNDDIDAAEACKGRPRRYP